MSTNDDYKTGNLLDYFYHQNYYKLTGIDLSRQANTIIPQQINSVGKLEEDDGETMFFIAENAAKNNCNFFFRFINCHRLIKVLEHQKIVSLLNEANDSKLVARKWNIVNDNSKTNYGIGSDIICNTVFLESNLCDYNDT